MAVPCTGSEEHTPMSSAAQAQETRGDHYNYNTLYLQGIFSAPIFVEVAVLIGAEAQCEVPYCNIL
jgi:hypothetical protein